MRVSDERLAKLERIAQQATPGPWCIESVGEKGDGSNMIGVAFGPDDTDAKNPLSGWLETWDKDGNEIEYYRDEEIAECEHRNRNAGPNAVHIATFSPLTTGHLIADLRDARAEIARLRVVANEIKEIMATYREQEAKGYVDTPGGLEHMGDVWRLLERWDAALKDTP